MTVAPTPTPTPTATLTVAPTPTPTPTPTPSGQTVTVSGTSASAIDSAVSAAKAKGTGTTVIFPAGTYTHGNLTWPDGINLQGAGVGQTQINCSVRFGSNEAISNATFGSSSSATVFHFTNAAHDTTITDARFRGPATICGTVSTTATGADPSTALTPTSMT